MRRGRPESWTIKGSFLEMDRSIYNSHAIRVNIYQLEVINYKLSSSRKSIGACKGIKLNITNDKTRITDIIIIVIIIIIIFLVPEVFFMAYIWYLFDYLVHRLTLKKVAVEPSLSRV